MALNQNVKDIITLSLVVGHAGLIGYKISKLVMKHKLEKKLNADIKFADKQIDENTKHRDEALASVYKMDLTTTEKEAKLYHTASLWQEDIDRYTGYQWKCKDVLNYVEDITKV